MREQARIAAVVLIFRNASPPIAYALKADFGTSRWPR